MPLHQATPLWFRRWCFATLQYIQMKYLLATVEFQVVVPFFMEMVHGFIENVRFLIYYKCALSTLDNQVFMAVIVSVGVI